MEVISHKAGWKINQNEEGKCFMVLQTMLLFGVTKIDVGKKKIFLIIENEKKFFFFVELSHTDATKII